MNLNQSVVLCAIPKRSFLFFLLGLFFPPLIILFLSFFCFDEKHTHSANSYFFSLFFFLNGIYIKNTFEPQNRLFQRNFVFILPEFKSNYTILFEKFLSIIFKEEIS